VVATPVAPPEVFDRLSKDADEVVVVETPEPFFAIGQFYLDFSQTPDSEVTSLLGRAGAPSPHAGHPGFATPPFDDDVEIVIGDVELGGRLTIPEGSSGTVVFVHGSGSSRHSPRNRHVAVALNRAGLGTLLFDLLSAEEEVDRANVFDIQLLAERLSGAIEWLVAFAGEGGPIGLFGASTGAAAALWAASEPGSDIAAVVSRGGRPDLAGSRLAEVRSPTLLIVGGRDDVVLELNRSAQARLRCENRLDVIPGATHLFEEPGALDRVADLAGEWFGAHFHPDSG
jgi:putative phosphoribosyl transferase